MDGKDQKPLLLPSYGDFVFFIVFLFQIILLPHFIFGDASTGWHLSLGEYTLDKHDVPRCDFISYTLPGTPWPSFYWLADTILALVARLAGTNGLAVLIAGTIAWLYLSLYDVCRKNGCNVLVSSTLVLIGANASTVHWLVRPHIVTFLGTFIFATALESFHRGQITAKRLLITLGIAMLIWVNSHPGFVVGFACLGIYAAAAVIGMLFAKTTEQQSKSFSQLKVLLGSACVCAVMTFLTPYGLSLHANLTNYLRMVKVLDSVDEYMSPIFHYSFQSLSLELVFFSLLGALAMTKKRPSLPQTLLVVFFFHLALNANRNIPLFVIVVVPYISALLSDTVFNEHLNFLREKSPFLRSFFDQWETRDKDTDAVESRCTIHLLPLLLIILYGASALNGGKLFGHEMMDCGFDPKRVPTTTLKCIEDNKLEPTQGFNEVNWGGYLYWKTKRPIFIDDRASLYGEDFYLQYGRVISLYPDWKDILNKYKITWIIFPKDHAFARRLKTDPEWRVLCEDTAADVFVRKLPQQ